MLNQLANSPYEVTPFYYTAILYHDVIYDPTRDDNEEQSAIFYEELEEDVDPKIIQVIKDTKDHRPTIEESKLLIDLDLSILASSSEEYENYLSKLSREYSFLTIDEKIVARKAFLEDRLNREEIFYTDYFKNKHENRARQNMQNEFLSLSGLSHWNCMSKKYNPIDDIPWALF